MPPDTGEQPWEVEREVMRPKANTGDIKVHTNEADKGNKFRLRIPDARVPTRRRLHEILRVSVRVDMRRSETVRRDVRVMPL